MSFRERTGSGVPSFEFIKLPSPSLADSTLRNPKGLWILFRKMRCTCLDGPFYAVVTNNPQTPVVSWRLFLAYAHVQCGLMCSAQAPKLMKDLLFSDTVIQTRALGFAATEGKLGNSMHRSQMLPPRCDLCRYSPFIGQKCHMATLNFPKAGKCGSPVCPEREENWECWWTRAALQSSSRQLTWLRESSLDFSELSGEIEARGGNLAGKPVASVFSLLQAPQLGFEDSICSSQ